MLPKIVIEVFREFSISDISARWILFIQFAEIICTIFGGANFIDSNSSFVCYPLFTLFFSLSLYLSLFARRSKENTNRVEKGIKHNESRAKQTVACTCVYNKKSSIRRQKVIFFIWQITQELKRCARMLTMFAACSFKMHYILFELVHNKQQPTHTYAMLAERVTGK